MSTYITWRLQLEVVQRLQLEVVQQLPLGIGVISGACMVPNNSLDWIQRS